MEGSASEFMERFRKLQDEAKEYGLSILTLIYENDPLKEESFMHSVRTCPPHTAIGMCRDAEQMMLNEIRNA